MASKPLVTVIMPAYNSEPFIEHAIRSILRQTYRQFELVVVDDGSTDGTAEVVASHGDPRVNLVQLPRNCGLASARNAGLAAARGEFIAWLDSDDISEPTRLSRQVDLLVRHPRVGICGTWVRTFGPASPTSWRYPVSPGYVRAQMLFDDPVATSAVMIRRDALPSSEQVFRRAFEPSEDYDLWERVARDWEATNVRSFLTRYRIHPHQTSTLRASNQEKAVREVQARQLRRLGLNLGDDEWRVHRALGVGWGAGLTLEDTPLVKDWIHQILMANNERRVFRTGPFSSVLRQRLRLVLNHMRPSVFSSAAIRLHTARACYVP